MTLVKLGIGDHTIELKLNGYDTLTMSINVTTAGVVTCNSVVSGSCGNTTPPGVVVSGTTITTYLKISAAVSTYNDWVISKGGAAGLKGNILALLEILDGFTGITNLGFTVTIANVLSTLDYFIGI